MISVCSQGFILKRYPHLYFQERNDRTSRLRIEHKPEYQGQRVHVRDSSIPSIPIACRTPEMKIHQMHSRSPARVCFYHNPVFRIPEPLLEKHKDLIFVIPPRRMCQTCLVEIFSGVSRN